jgi:hypothetical protein
MYACGSDGAVINCLAHVLDEVRWSANPFRKWQAHPSFFLWAPSANQRLLTLSICNTTILVRLNDIRLDLGREEAQDMDLDLFRAVFHQIKGESR